MTAQECEQQIRGLRWALWLFALAYILFIGAVIVACEPAVPPRSGKVVPAVLPIVLVSVTGIFFLQILCRLKGVTEELLRLKREREERDAAP